MYPEYQKPIDGLIQAMKGLWVPAYIDSIPDDGKELDSFRSYQLSETDDLTVMIMDNRDGTESVSVERTYAAPVETILAATALYQSLSVDLGEWNFLLQAVGEWSNRWRINLDPSLQYIETLSWSKNITFNSDDPAYIDAPMIGVESTSFTSARMNTVGFDVPYGSLQRGIFPQQIRTLMLADRVVLAHSYDPLVVYSFDEQGQPVIAELMQGVSPEHAAGWLGYVNNALDTALGVQIPLLQPIDSYRTQMLSLVQSQLIA